jgi:hypothetical protein
MMKILLAGLAAALVLPGSAMAEDTIKLGVANIDTGPYAVSGAFVNDGANFAVESLNAQSGALGRKYELVIQNHEGKPASAIEAAYVSRWLLRSAAREDAPLIPFAKSIWAAVLFADISGFTQMTRLYQDRGDAGVEELALIVGRYLGGSSTSCSLGAATSKSFTETRFSPSGPRRSRIAMAPFAAPSDARQ